MSLNKQEETRVLDEVKALKTFVKENLNTEADVTKRILSHIKKIETVFSSDGKMSAGQKTANPKKEKKE